MSRHVFTIFCDDIRKEQGNKLTFVGVYSGTLILNKIPMVLPKLCLFIKAMSPVSKPFKSMTIRVFFDKDLIADVELPPEQVNSSMLIAETTGTRETGMLHTVVTSLTFSPFQIERAGTLRVRVIADGKELKAPGLQVELNESLNEDGMSFALTPNEENTL